MEGTDEEAQAEAELSSSAEEEASLRRRHLRISKSQNHSSPKMKSKLQSGGRQRNFFPSSDDREKMAADDGVDDEFLYPDEGASSVPAQHSFRNSLSPSSNASVRKRFGRRSPRKTEKRKTEFAVDDPILSEEEEDDPIEQTVPPIFRMGKFFLSVSFWFSVFWRHH